MHVVFNKGIPTKAICTEDQAAQSLTPPLEWEAMLTDMHPCDTFTSDEWGGKGNARPILCQRNGAASSCWICAVGRGERERAS